MGSSFDDFVSAKVKPIEGDMLKENLGLSIDNLQEIIDHTHVYTI